MDEVSEVRKDDIFDKLFKTKKLSRFENFFQKHRRGLLYLFFGGLTTLVNLGLSAVFWYAFGWEKWYITVFGERVAVGTFLGNFISIVLSIVFAYVTNRTWVFKNHAKGVKATWNEFVRFIGGRVVTLVLELGLVQVATILFPDDGRLLYAAKIITQILVVLINYLFSRFFVFKKQEDVVSENDVI